MICSFCSLLCDADAAHGDRTKVFDCSRRDQSIVRLSAIRENQSAAPSELVERSLCEARAHLKAADRVLITGRIASVATARSAVRLAAELDATLDCAEEGHVFKNILAIQRSGLNSVSLAEARSMTDLFIVVGDDAMLDACPRMPMALQSDDGQQRMVLLLGSFRDESIQRWRESGFVVWSVECQISEVPKALNRCYEWVTGLRSTAANPGEGSFTLFDSMVRSRYTTVVWSAANLQVQQPDLWVERMLQWIASQNETTRCAAIPWSSLDGTFQQVCTWLTGFPGRIRFQGNVPHYDPGTSSYDHWMAGSGELVMGQVALDKSVVVVIDETATSTPFLPPLGWNAQACRRIELTPESEVFKTAVAGAEVPAEVFRADQTVLARVEPFLAIGTHVRSASYWLEKLAT